MGAVHLAHPAGANERIDHVGPKDSAGSKRSGGVSRLSERRPIHRVAGFENGPQSGVGGE